MSRLMPWGGTYQVTMEIGLIVREFKLGTSLLGGTDVLDGTLDGVDVTEDVQEISISRGRQTQLDEFSAGTCTVKLVDTAREYDPVNTSSPYYNPITAESGVTIRRKVTVFYDSTPIFTGRITDVDIEFEPTSTPISRSYVTIKASDAFTVLASTRIEEFFPEQELAGARISTIFALPEVNYTGSTDIDTGTVLLEDEPIADQTSLLDYLQQIAATERGYLFIKGSGTLRFSNRLGKFIVDETDPTSIVEVVDPNGETLFQTPFLFSDDGTGSADYETLSVLYGQEQLYNRIICTPQGSSFSGVADDLASQTTFGISVLNLSGLLCTDVDAQKLADYLLRIFSTPRYRFDSLSLSFAGNKISPSIQQNIIDLELGSIIRINKSFAIGTPTTFNQVVSIEGIDHSITPQAHKITYRTTARDKAFIFTLDDPKNGRLDQNNALT